MIVDTSAIVAVVMQEPGFDLVQEKLVAAEHSGIGAPTLTETGIVLSSLCKQDMRGPLSQLLAEASIDVVPFVQQHYSTAVGAWWRFGKGRHKANLNFGDCMSYAVARVADHPLLCIGNDFVHTDLELV